MLKQMGYDPDSRTGAGAEPVSIEIRHSRAGLGAEEPVLALTSSLAPVEKPREVSEQERRQQEEMAAELREDSRNGLPEHLVRLGRPDLARTPARRPRRARRRRRRRRAHPWPR
jgi:hypothetical protein